MTCFHCGRAIAVDERGGFRDRCPGCDRPQHACLNCAHHDPAYHNQCRETQADLVADKDRANFCEYFRPRAASPARAVPKADDARARLDALFKKKS
jgi:hypothetical protein